jgi:hypothetical protein
MHPIQAASPTTRLGAAPGATARSAGRGAPAALRALGALGLLGILTSAALISADAAARPSELVPAREGGWPGWLAGPLSGLGSGISRYGFQTLLLVMCGSYVLVLLSARALPLAAIVATIALAHLLALLGPPLISQDVFGYIAYARMGALHGLDPYTHVPAEAPTDAAFAFVGWPFKHSPYGPLFTLASYATAPLGVAGAMWAFKAVAAAASLGAVALVGRAAAGLGRPLRWTLAFVGLNPVLLVLAVGGAHNDTLVMLAVAAGLALSVTASRTSTARAAAAFVAGVGVKVSAGVTLPFLALSPRDARERLRALGAIAAWLAVLAVIALAGFGSGAFGFVNALGDQQQLVATHSIPAETARLLGLSGTPAWWRHLLLVAFAAVLAWQAHRCWRGAEWRACAGWTMLALLLATAWLLPWYAIWLLPLAAVGDDRRLRGATLLFCAYAVLIHLPLADPLLVPARHFAHHRLLFPVPGARERLELSGFQVLRDVTVDLRW